MPMEESLPVEPLNPPVSEEQLTKSHAVETRLITTSVLRIQLMRLAMKGMTATDAAKALGCCSKTALMHYKSKEFRQAVFNKVEHAFEDIDQTFVEQKKTLHEKLEEQAARSFEDLVNMLGDEKLPSAHRIKINQDFLNRSEQTQPMHKVTTGGVDADVLMRAAQVASEMEAGNVVPIKKVSNG